jgi:uncharacterized membrane protein
MTTPALCALFGVLGCLEDYIVSLYYRAISAKNASRSAGISFIHTCLVVFILAALITGHDILPMLSYAFGGACGTYLGVKR